MTSASRNARWTAPVELDVGCGTNTSEGPPRRTGELRNAGRPLRDRGILNAADPRSCRAMRDVFLVQRRAEADDITAGRTCDQIDDRRQ